MVLSPGTRLHLSSPGCVRMHQTPNRRRVQHRKHPSDTFAWAASALLTELPPGSLPNATGASAGQLHHPAHGPSPLYPGGPTADAAALALGPGGLGGSILPDDLLDLLRDVDEDNLHLDLDEVCTDGIVDTSEDLNVLESQLAASGQQSHSAGAAPGAPALAGLHTSAAGAPAQAPGSAAQQGGTSHFGLPGHSVVTTSAAGLLLGLPGDMARQQQHQQQASDQQQTGARANGRRACRRGSDEPAEEVNAMDSPSSSPAGAGKVSQRGRKAAAASGAAATKRGTSASGAGSGPDEGGAPGNNGSGSFALPLSTGGGARSRHRRSPSDLSEPSASGLPGALPLPLPLVGE